VADACGPVAFGLRHARTPTPAAQLDWAAVGYDEDSQLGVFRDGDAVVPLCRHSTGQTGTSTASSDSSPGDSDKDATED
jgi:putative ATP-grasp target RiPP